MFFRKMKDLEEKAESDIYALSQQPHTDRTYIDMMHDKAEAVRNALSDIREKARSRRDKAWLLWVCTGIPNMFNPIGWLVLPIGLISLAACAVTGYQALKARAATQCIRKFDTACKDHIETAQQARESYIEAQRLAGWREHEAKKKSAIHTPAAAKPAADGFNAAASDLDLDADVTVRRIKLKPRDPAVAA